MNVTPNTFPALRYADAPAALQWLASAFGFQKQAAHLAPDGSVAHAELSLGAGIIGVNSAGRVDPSNPWTTVRQGMYVCLPEVDAHYARAREAGADIARPLADTSYGSREYSVRDPEGHLWSFGTYDMGARPGEPNIFVGLRCRDPRGEYNWLARAFGFEPGIDVPGADGELMHGELKVGTGGLVMVESGAYGADKWIDNTQAVHVYLADPDAHHARARAAGATILQAPADTTWGARAYYARDPEGFLWGFSTYQPLAARPVHDRGAAPNAVKG